MKIIIGQEEMNHYQPHQRCFFIQESDIVYMVELEGVNTIMSSFTRKAKQLILKVLLPVRPHESSLSEKHLELGSKKNTQPSINHNARPYCFDN